MILKLAYKHRNHAKWIPVILFFVVCTIFWVSGSVRYGGDSPRYIEGAERLLAGKAVDDAAIPYLGYVILVSAIYFLKLGDVGVIAVQIILSAFAALAIFDLGRRLVSEAVGLIAVSLYVVNLEIQQWSFYVLTESLYISALILACWIIYRTIESSKPIAWIAMSVVLTVCMATIRPNGWVMIPLMIMFLIIGVLRKYGSRLACYALAIACLVAGNVFWLPYTLGLTNSLPVQLFLQGSDSYLTLVNGEIIWSYADLKLDMPIDENPVGSGLVGVLNYCARHRGDCARLFSLRVVVELAYVRPYYSSIHNWAIALSLPAMYLLALIGFYEMRKEFFAWLALLLMSVHFLSVAATWADYNGRFLIYVFPLITLFGAIGLFAVIQKARSHIQWRNRSAF